MTTYQSIRIYISSTASILPNGFYDVIGFYGIQVGSSTDPYHIDPVINCPVIKTNGQYYYLAYRDVDGFIPNLVENGSEDLHLLTSSTMVPIYLNQRSDANIISNYDRPLVNNIVIDNIDNLYTAYRVLYVDVYDNYAIERFDSIVDRNNIIDVVDADFVLSAQNPDGVTILPSEGNVVSLKAFELTFPNKVFTAADTAMLRKIALYDYNTQNIAVGIDVNSMTYTIGGNVLTFSLLAEVNSPSQYFLYIPSGAFTFENNVLSRMAMFAYTISSQQGGGDVFEFIYSPTQTKTLKTVKVTFVNVASIIGVSYVPNISVLYPDNSVVYHSASDVLSAGANEVTITLPESIVNIGTENEQYIISLPPNTVHVRADEWNNIAISLVITVVPATSELPTSDDRYGIQIFPAQGEVHEVRYLNILVKILRGNFGRVDVNSGHQFSEIELHGGSDPSYPVVDTISEVNIKNQYTNEDGDIVYEYDCLFGNHNNSLESYTVIIPSELFTITLLENGESETLYNQSYELHYNIKQQDPENGGDDDPNGAHMNFGYKLLLITGIPGSTQQNLAFRHNDTIIINRNKLDLIGTTPCLTITRLDHENGDAVLSKDTLQVTSGDQMDISIRCTYYNDENVEVSTTSTANYGYELGRYIYTDLTGLFPMLRSGYPNYMRLTYIFNYNGTELTHELELQIVPEYIFNKVKENLSWNIGLRFDLYSGTQTDYQWGCMYLTGLYDCILNYKTKETSEPENEGDEPVITETTHYIAELVPTTKVRTGNLTGIYNEKFGVNQPQGYGLYGENVYLTGNFYLNNGKSLMDISDDILLATGDVNEIRDSLNNLDTSVKATIEALSLRQETFEHGLDASIKNYISTNKNAVLKIGLDYSIWALGSAGITMVNPNATYDFDPITGNYSVNPDTVGDGDEYIALQGSKIAINTYHTEWLVDPTDNVEKEYHEVIATTVNPALWEYDADGSIYIPKRGTNNILFVRGYIESLTGLSTASIPQTEETRELLKYANFNVSSLTSSKVIENELVGFMATGSPSEDTEVYAFTTYYMDTEGSHSIKIKREYTNDNDESVSELVNLIDYTGDTTIYFVPRLEQSGLFKNGKFNSKYIEAENLVAVDVNDVDYIKNRRFDPTAEIKDDNYPVLNASDNTPAKDANFVVVSGTTGKLTAKGADIRGSITIGDHENEGDTYVAISDNKADNKIEDVNYPALYILKHQGLGKREILAKFSGANVSDVASLYSSVTTRSIGEAVRASVTTTHSMHATLQHEWVNTGGDNGGFNPKDPTVVPRTRAISSPGSGGSNRTYYYWYSCSYRPNGSTTGSRDVYYIKTSQETVTEFSLAANESRTIQLEGALVLHGTAGANSHKGQLSLSGSLYIINTETNQKNTIKYFSKYSSTTTSSITLDETYELTFTNTATAIKNTNGQRAVNFKIVLEVTQSYSSSWETTKTTNSNPSAPSASIISTTSWAQINANYKIKEGGDGYVANFFGNGLAVGFNALNNFHAYYIKGSGSDSWWDKDRMRIAFKASGIGMSFEDGQYFQHLADHKMAGFIPILVGMIRYNEWFYYFEGRSLMSNGYYSSSYSNDKIRMQCPPYYSNHFYDASWWDELWGGSDVNYQGLRVNTSTNSLLDTDAKYNCVYNSTHDIYIVRVSYGIITILFGEKWNSLFSAGPVFLSSDAMKISTTGIGKDSWNGSTSETTRVPVGSMFITAKPPIVNGNGIQVDANRKPTLFRDPDADSVYNVTYGATTTNTPKFCNAFCFNLADDSALNDGSFYICLEVCPNMVTA